MKIYELHLRFHKHLFMMFELTLFKHLSDNILAPTKWQAIIWTNELIEGKFTDVYMHHSALMS